MVTIELSDEDSIKFQMFCQYYEKFSILQSSGALDIVAGKSIVNFDNRGIITHINADAVVYIRKKEYIIDKTVTI